MNESFEIKGIWYLPEQDVDKNDIQGILKYSPERIVLDLIGTFQGEINETFFTKSLEKKVIYGFSNYGEHITLFDCFPLTSQMNAPGFDTSSYIANYFLAGTRYIKSGNEEIIKNCTFSFTYLDAWLDLHVMDMDFIYENGNVDISIDFSKAIEQKKTIKIETENVFIREEIFRSINYPQNYYSEETTKIIFKRFYSLSSIDNRLLSYDKCFDILHKLKRLLTMLIGSPLHVLYIELNLPEEISFDDSLKKETKHCCRSFFNQVGDINCMKKISPHKPNSILIYRGDIKDRIENVFDSWFSLQDEISEIANPYIMDLYLPAYQENKFLNIVRCLETYHRTFVEIPTETKTMEDSDFRNSRAEIVSFINSAIPEESRQSFLDRINYVDQNSLQKRLRDVLKKAPPSLLKSLFGSFNSKDLSKMVQKVVQTRNYYTHRDNRQKYPMSIDNRVELGLYIKKLGVILQFWILSRIGIDQKIIEKRLIEFNQHFIE